MGPAITLWENRIYSINKKILQDHHADLLLDTSGLQSDLLVVEARARGQFFWASGPMATQTYNQEPNNIQQTQSQPFHVHLNQQTTSDRPTKKNG